MKKKLLSVLALASLGIGITLSSCGGNSGNNGGNGGNNGDEPPVTDTEKLVTDITLTEESKTLGVGANYQLEWTVAPSDADNKDVTFASSDTSVASVSEEGLITALKIGTSTITVSSADKGDVTASFNLTVEEVKYIQEIEILNYTSTYKYTTVDGVEKIGFRIEVDNTNDYQVEYKITTPESEYNDDSVIFYTDPDEDFTLSEDGLITFTNKDFKGTISFGAYNPEQLTHKGEPGWYSICLADVTLEVK